MKSVIALVIWASFLSSALRAEIAVGITAEWLCSESSLIAVATPIDVQTIESRDRFRFTKCRYRLDDVIKGPQSVGDLVTVFESSRRQPDAVSLDRARKNGTQLLLFVTVAESFHRDIDGKYILVQENVSDLKSAYFSNLAVDNLYTPDFKRLVKFAELLQRTRTQVMYELELKRQNWHGTIRKKSIEVPHGSDAYKDLYAGSTCYLWVPEYETVDHAN